MEHNTQIGVTAPRADSELAAWLNACAEGEQWALHSLYRHTSARLFPIVLRMVKIRAVAEDVLRDTYVTIWRRAGDYNGSVATPIGWISQIARRLARQRMDTAAYRSEISSLEDRCPTSNPEVYFARLQQVAGADALRLSLSDLSPEARHLILRTYCDGSSVAELGELMGNSEEDVRRQLHQGLDALQQRDEIDEN